MAWTEEQKKQAVKMYEDAEPTPETSTEIVKDIADELEQSANGVRQVLVQAGVYLKKEPTATNKTTAKEGGKRVSKESQISELREAIKETGATPNEEILEKMTGKAAAYFTEVLRTKK